jgi:hypothetical protein
VRRCAAAVEQIGEARVERPEQHQQQHGRRQEVDRRALHVIEQVRLRVVVRRQRPGEAFVDGVFVRHASLGALLLTFHDLDHVLVQRKLAHNEELLPLGWM